ncbi:lyase family protein [Aquincola tertiaricarbonis]|uniref:lyase family protein n=1 Tax=Aquincola tertiaricarbonis TaxID=391953 RepID=UPI000614E06B|nr:lyase family protein [Aquincola tertiaricarbonis]
MSGFAFEGFLSTPQMLAVFGEASVIQSMMDFEAALARAEAAVGLIPQAAATAIAGVCRAELYDVPALVAASGRAGSLAIPLVKRLTDTVALFDAQAAQVVHWGGTSQDVIDTGMVLLTRRALALIDDDLSALNAALLALAAQHAGTPVMGRTLMQPASVVSFGFKVLEWATPLVRCQQRLHAQAARALQLQFGGAVGTLATLGEHGPAVAQHMATQLGLPPWQGAWHTQRDDWVALGCELGVLVGALGKFARDLSLMSQGEIGELAEPTGAGRGGSTALPHKRNPVASMVALAAAQRTPHRVAALLGAMGQEHERGLGNWQAELAEWAGLFISAHGAVHALAEAAAGLQVHPQRMRGHIEALQGLVSAEACTTRLAGAIGKPEAQRLLEQLSQQVMAEGRHLRELVQQAVQADARLREAVPAAEIDRLFDPDHAAQPAARRTQEQLARLQPLAAQLAAARPFADAASPTDPTQQEQA